MNRLLFIFHVGRNIKQFSLVLEFSTSFVLFLATLCKAFANPEDAGVHGKTPEDKKKMLRTDSDVERVRR